MLQLLFTCKRCPTQTLAQVDSVQKQVWRRCEDRDIGGFFVRSGHLLIGLFEGREKTVIGMVEYLIRKHRIKSIRVVRETALSNREWPQWSTDLFDLDQLSGPQRENFEGLAQIVEFAVDADRKGSFAH